MAIKEQDVVLVAKDISGNKVIQMPITRVENVEGAIKTVNKVAPDATGNVAINTIANATKATQDASGNVITTTYATKTELSKKLDASSAFTKAQADNLYLGKSAKATSASVADTATSATKTTQDASGNVITTTYATKTEVTAGLSGKLDKTEKATSAITADTATSATQDARGNVITTTYATKSEVNTGLAGKAPSSHTHTSAQITDLRNTLAPYAKTTDVNTGLVGKANKAHTHTVSQITDMPKVVLSVNDITPDDSGNVKVGALPLGHLFAWPFQTPPDGAIQCNGATYNRALYKDFFAYATSKGWVKTEAEWQEIAERDNGFCPFYSEGDGSTNFRTPKFAPFIQIAIASANVGKYLKAGLPNITGRVYDKSGSNSPAWTVNPKQTEATGAFRIGSEGGYTGSGTSQNGMYAKDFNFDASRSNAIYGRSTTVQPESHEWMICVVVAGQATNLGSVDMADVLTTVAQVQADVSQVQAQMDELSGVAGDVTKLKRFFNGTFTKTLLAGGLRQSDWIGSGNITLAKPWDNFDALLIYSGTDSSDHYLNSTLIYKWQLSELFAIAKTSGKRYVQIWNNVAGHFWGVNVSSSTSIAFKDPDENSGLQAIYGLKC